MKHDNNPFVRLLVGLLAFAVGVRLAFWLLVPVWPYLLAAVVVWGGLQLVWWRHRNW